MSRPVWAVAFCAVLGLLMAAAPSRASGAADGRSVAEYWTADRMADAVPRDLVIDEQGRGYLRLPTGALQPYGNQTPVADGAGSQPAADPRVKPDKPGGGGGDGGGGGNDSTGPTVTNPNPASGTVLTASSHTFSVDVTDDSGVKSVTFHLAGPNGPIPSVSASPQVGDTWSAEVTSLVGGGWTWYVEARDGAKKGGNTNPEELFAFTVTIGTDGGSGGDGGTDEPVVANAAWTGGAVQTAAGRIYFEMPGRGPNWNGYVCSGTVATDGTTDRSIIITAAHCVYDDANKVFARNVLFIPNQAGTTASGTNRDCSDDPLGCWAPSHGVVDDAWADQTWPDNIPWDYAYYVVPDTEAHTAGLSEGTDPALDKAAGSLPVEFTAPTFGDYTHALGYSYSDDPNFMFCAEGLSTNSYGSNWLGSCELSGGASGGPWVQPMDTANGTGPIVSVNSYGYSDRPGMGGPLLTESASCVFEAAKTVEVNPARGHVATCP